MLYKNVLLLTHFFYFFIHTINMELVFVIISIFVLIVTFNIFINANIEYNFYNNIGYVKFRIFNICIFKGEISFIAGYFNFIRKNKKVIQIKLDFNDENFKLITDIGEYFFKKIHINKLALSANSMSYSPNLLAIICSIYYTIYGLSVSYLSNKLPDCEFENLTKISFFNNELRFKIDMSVLLTLFDLIWAIVRAIMKRSVYGKKQIGRDC